MGARVRIFLCAIAVSLSYSLAFADSGQDQKEPNARASNIVLPLEYVDQHLYVTLNDEKLGALTLIVDTGWQHTTVDEKIAAKGDPHGSFWKRKLSTKGFGEQGHDHKYLTVPIALRHENNLVFSTSALVLDLGELSRRTAHRLDGALGWDFFRSSCVTLDYAAKQMTVQPASDCRPPAGRHGTMRGQWSSQGVRLQAVVTTADGKTAKTLLEIDTGSNNTVFLHPRFRSALGLTATGSDQSARESWGVNGTYQSDSVIMKSVEIEAGKIRFDGHDGTTITIGRSGSYNAKSDGVLGNALLEKASWTLDALAKRIYISMPETTTIPNPVSSLPTPE